MTRLSILFVQYSSDRNGSAISGLSLLNGLGERGWETHVAFGYPGPMEEDYRASGHQTFVVEHKSWLRRSHLLRFLKDLLIEWRRAPKFEALIEQIKPDVVYINTSVSLAGAVAAKRRSIKVVWHLRELFSDVGGEMVAPTIAKPFIRSLIKRLSDRIVVNSKAVAKNLLGTSLAQTVLVVPNAMSDASFDQRQSVTDARKELGLPLDAAIVGVPGTLRPMKGHSFFFRAVSKLQPMREDLVFAITGDGEEHFVATLKTEVEELGLQQRVSFLGVLDGLTVFYRACDIICIPSKAEPFGRVVIEAFAAGTPVIATAVGGIPEIVEDRVNGLLVPYGDTQALTDSIEELLANADLRAKLAADARHKAENEYQEDSYKRKIVELVDVLARLES